MAYPYTVSFDRDDGTIRVTTPLCHFLFQEHKNGEVQFLRAEYFSSWVRYSLANLESATRVAQSFVKQQQVLRDTRLNLGAQAQKSALAVARARRDHLLDPDN